MYLKRLEIIGFKSFADKVTIEFKDGITAIVGPNGSGKSNITDAIKWVLGEQRIKSLRGSKMEDVIFSGTQVRKPLGYAQVSLTIDNQSGIFPIEYSEVNVTRRIYRSGESEYFINKSSCRLKDVQDLFSDTGLGREGYSIIGQGKIDYIISSNPFERRLLLEEAAGIVKYKNRKQESERKLEKTQENLYRISDLICELERQLPSMKDQYNKAQTYLDLREKLKKVELNLFVHQVDSINKEINSLELQKNDALEDIRENKVKLEEQEGKYEQLRRDIQTIDDNLSEINSQLLNMTDLFQKHNTDIQVSLTKIEHNEKNVDSVNTDIHQLEEINDNLMEKIQALKKSISKAKESLNRCQSQLIQLEEDKAERESAVIQMRDEREEKEKKLDALNREIIQIENEIRILENNKIYRDESLQSRKETLGKLRDALQKEQVEKNQIERDIQLLNIETADINDKISKLKKQLGAELDKKKVIEGKIKHLQDQYNITNSRVKLMKNGEDLKGYFYGVRELLKEKKDNDLLKEKLHDAVANVVDVPKKYALAIETALGNSVHNLITEDDDTAHVCIDILKRKKWGRATFLPISTVRGRILDLETNIKSQRGFIDIAYNLVDFPREYTGIFKSLLGNVIIVQDMESGKSISRISKFKYKIVTLEGEIFYPGGAIVGGQAKHKNTGIIRRRQELLDLQRKSERLSSEIQTLRIESNQVEKIIDNLQKKIEKENHHYNELSTEKKVLEQKILQTDSSILEKMERLNTVQREIKAVTDKEIAENRSIVQLTDQLEALRAEKNQLESRELLSVDDSLEEEIKDVESKINQTNLEITKRREQMLYLQTQLNDITCTYEDNCNKLKSKRSDLERFRRELDDLHNKVAESKQLIEKYEEEKKILQDRYDKLSRQKGVLNQKVEENRKLIRELNEESIVVNEAYNKVVNKIDNKKFQLEQLQKNVYETYQVNYIMALEYKREIKNMKRELGLEKEYKKQIRSLGEVNVGAIEQYRELKDRYEFLTLQKDDLEKAKKSLEDIILQISNNMKTQFMANFNLIQKKFSETFNKLFDGGSAQLIINDVENIMDTGIDIQVQPPGKKLKNMSLLSGGEKAMTAIALLFAIINVKPAPFCVLDEIDAALDDNNVVRFSTFLREISDDNQFITITHRRGTMEIADRLFGVTMGKDGVSKIVSVELSEIQEKVN